ncbi:MAG: CBS domain-containing protein [Flavobacteriales bacterium]|nr:CBS domain-containing protein [Flavobacteriales bacterium]NQX98524.1 CBS domain-containing protein [Flavobacteriales bacterium]
MIASKLISYDIPPLKLSDTGVKALDWMEEFKTSELPVVDDGKYIGLIRESEILDRNDIDNPIKDYRLNFTMPFAYENRHLFEVISLIVENDINILPVVNQNEQYLGLITPQKIINHLSQIVSVTNAGSILTLEVNVKDYSLSEIARMVESDDAKVLSSFITSHPDSTKLEVTLKINKTEISRILHTFERFNYIVLASYNESEYHQDLKNRYDEFMRFLNP